ncbi:unnamed protein product [Ilex paraguariensis]|uniref:Uncharacterized protein n=1 Tax=Ilex paraguariensis TaxID=185542 RepID=A0ABC8RZX7_9AQUA
MHSEHSKHEKKEEVEEDKENLGPVSENRKKKFDHASPSSGPHREGKVKKEERKVKKEEADYIFEATTKKGSSNINKRRKKRKRKECDFPGQTRDPPDERYPLRIFYETLYKQAPNSEMAALWMMESGLLSKEVAKKVLKRKKKRIQQHKLDLPMKAVVIVKKNAETILVKRKTSSSSSPVSTKKTTPPPESKSTVMSKQSKK